MKQTTLTQRLLSALVALCMVLSVCAPALAANSSFIWIQKSSGYPTPVTSDNIGTLLPGYSIAYNGNTVTITMGSGQHTKELEGVTLIGGGQDLELCTAGTSWVTDISNENKTGLTITGMKNVTVKPARGSNIGFLGSLKIVDCTGDVNIQNSSYAAVVGRLEVDNSAGHGGSVTITENCDRADWGTYLPYGMIITSNGPVTIENENGCAVCGSLEIKESDSVDIKGTATNGRAAILGSATISSNGAVKIENQTSNDWKAGAAVGDPNDPNITGTILEVKKSASVEVIGAGVNPTLGGWAFIKSSGDVSITNSLGGSAVGRGLTVTTGGAVTVTGDNDAAIKSKATITAGRNVSIQNKSGIATLNNDADITSRGAVSITNTGSGLAVDGKLTVYNSGSVKVSGGNASAPAVSGDITLTSTGKMELSNPKGQVTNKKLTVKNSTGEVSVTGNKSDGSALVQGGASIDTTGAVTITNSSGPAIFSGLNVEQSGGITVTGSRASEPIITGSSTIKNTNKVEIINNGTNGQTAQSITYTPPAGKGYFYQTAQNGGKLHTRSAISSTTPYLCIEPDTLYTLTLPEGVTAKTNGISDTSFYAGEMVTVTAPADTDTKKFEKWTGGENIIEVDPNWRNSKTFTFKMPEGNVTLTADYKQLYNLTVTGGTIVGGNGDTGNYLPGTEVTIVFTESGDTTKQFEKWTYTGTAPAKPDGGWTAANDSTSKTFTFKMPAGDVSLKADYKQLYNLTVTGGTIVDGNGDTGNYLPGTEVTVVFTESGDITKQFEKWTYTGTAPAKPDGGWTAANDSTSKTFTFKMPAGNVTLTADYMQLYNLTVTGGTIVDENEPSKTTGIYLPGTEVTIRFTASTGIEDQFEKWTGGENITEVDPNWQNSSTFTFKMPEGDVTLTAKYKTAYTLTVADGTILVNGMAGNRALAGDQITVTETGSDKYHLFSSWQLTSSTALVEPSENWENSKTFTFKMPAGDVTLEAVYRETYYLYEDKSNAEFFVDGKQVHQAPADVRVTVKLVDDFINDHHEFDQWLPAGGTALVAPEEGWAHKPSFSFIMPEGSVLLQVHTTFLYDVNVTHGTIVDGTGDTGTFQKIVKPGQPVTVRAESTEENPFLQWTYIGKAPEAPEGGWPEGDWQTSPEFTFKMPNGNVTLDAQLDQLYKVSINDSLGSVTINGEPRSSLWVKEGETVTVATTLKDGYWMEFEKWNSTGTAPEEPEGGWTETNKSTSTTFTFKMPNGPVELVAQWSASSLDPYQPIDPDEPLDEDFGVEPDTTGGTIAAVAVGGAAIWGGYEIATRVILHSLLPEGTVIPASRGQLALLVWNTAGRPEPAGAPAFADVTDPDMAKAAQWCTEQGTMAAKGDRFEPEGWTPKFKVIEVWNKTFPAA